MEECVIFKDSLHFSCSGSHDGLPSQSMDSLQIKLSHKTCCKSWPRVSGCGSLSAQLCRHPCSVLSALQILLPLPGGVSQCECSLTVPGFPVSGILGGMVGFCHVLENQRTAEVARNLCWSPRELHTNNRAPAAHPCSAPLEVFHAQVYLSLWFP